MDPPPLARGKMVPRWEIHPTNPCSLFRSRFEVKAPAAAAVRAGYCCRCCRRRYLPQRQQVPLGAHLSSISITTAAFDRESNGALMSHYCCCCCCFFLLVVSGRLRYCSQTCARVPFLLWKRWRWKSDWYPADCQERLCRSMLVLFQRFDWKENVKQTSGFTVCVWQYEIMTDEWEMPSQLQKVVRNL